MSFRNPISPIQSLGTVSVPIGETYGTTFSNSIVGGFMQVNYLSDLIYTIPSGQTGTIEYSGNTIPINFIKGTGSAFSRDVLILNSDNLSSGRKKIGMLVYVREQDQVYQYTNDNFLTLWNAATAATGTVVISDFGTTVNNSTAAGQNFINSWTASTIDGYNGVVRSNAVWKKYYGNTISLTGGSYNSGTGTLTLTNITGGTVNITGVTATGGGTTITGGTYDNQYGDLILVNNTGGTVSVSGFTNQKILLNRIELGTIVGGCGFGCFTKWFQIFSNSFNEYTVNGWNVDYYFTVNNGSYRETILYKTETYGVNYDPYTTFGDLINFIDANFSSLYVNGYCETYINTSSTHNGVQRITLANTLFNSLQYRNYSTSLNRAYGIFQFVTDNNNYIPNILTNNLGNSNNWSNYYDIATSEDITKKIYDIITEPSNPFYGPLSGSAFSAITDATIWNNSNRAFITKSVYVESTHNYYKNFNIPTNLFCKFSHECTYNINNFYADLFIDNIGGSQASIAGNSTDNTLPYYSPAFIQLVDNYKVLPSGNTYIVTTFGTTTSARLNDLQYTLKIPKYKYLPTRVGGTYTADNEALEILPGYQNVYLINITSTISNPVDANTFVYDFLTNYYIRSCPDTLVNNYFGVNNINNFAIRIGPSTPSPYGNYIMTQSNDTKMTSLAAIGTFTYGSGSVTINSIYKGYSFRPLIYPLNFNQLSFEVPSGYFYNSDTLSIDQNTYWDENNFVIDGSYNITNKVLRVIVNFKKLNKKTFFDLPIKVTVPVVGAGTLNKFFRVITENPIETSIYSNLRNSERKNLKPNSIEISFAFYDNSTLTTSIIPNYKMIVVKSGENDVFKIVKGSTSY